MTWCLVQEWNPDLIELVGLKVNLALNNPLPPPPLSSCFKKGYLFNDMYYVCKIKINNFNYFKYKTLLRI